jgi:hypothetical protein
MLSQPGQLLGKECGSSTGELRECDEQCSVEGMAASVQGMMRRKENIIHGRTGQFCLLQPRVRSHPRSFCRNSHVLFSTLGIWYLAHRSLAMRIFVSGCAGSKAMWATFRHSLAPAIQRVSILPYRLSDGEHGWGGVHGAGDRSRPQMSHEQAKDAERAMEVLETCRRRRFNRGAAIRHTRREG